MQRAEYAGPVTLQFAATWGEEHDADRAHLALAPIFGATASTPRGCGCDPMTFTFSLRNDRGKRLLLL